MVAGPVAPAVLTAMELSERADADGLAEVDVACNGGGADVEPVRVVRAELLVCAGLDDVDPCRHLELAGPLQVRRVRLDEGIGTVELEEGHERREVTRE